MIRINEQKQLRKNKICQKYKKRGKQLTDQDVQALQSKWVLTAKENGEDVKYKARSVANGLGHLY